MDGLRQFKLHQVPESRISRDLASAVGCKLLPCLPIGSGYATVSLSSNSLIFREETASNRGLKRPPMLLGMFLLV